MRSRGPESFPSCQLNLAVSFLWYMFGLAKRCRCSWVLPPQFRQLVKPGTPGVGVERRPERPIRRL